MLSTNSDERGSIFWMLVFVIVVVGGLYAISQRTNLFGVSNVETSNETSSALEEVGTEDNSEGSATRSFTAVNEYDTSRGKIVISNDKFRNSTITISAVMPSEFPGTYYKAEIVGTDVVSDISLGKLSKTDGSGSFTVERKLNRPIGDYSQIIISVDGEAATVEGKTLPHNVMVLDL